MTNEEILKTLRTMQGNLIPFQVIITMEKKQGGNNDE
jgi:hypothetical protein